LFMARRDHGILEMFRQSDDAAVLLAMLIALVGLGTHYFRTLRGLDGFLFGLAALISFSAFLPATSAEGVPTYHRWFISHGLAFTVSGACFLAGGTASLIYLLVHRTLRNRNRLALIGKIPSLEALDQFSRWMLTIGFPLFTYGILTGLCGVAHRRDIRRIAWYLDPSVIFSIVVWGIYAYLLWSLTFKPQVRGRKAAALATAGLWLVVVVFLARDFLSPIHQ